MRREIDILLKAARKNCLVVEKGRYVIWTLEDLHRASEADAFPEESELEPPDGTAGVAELPVLAGGNPAADRLHYYQVGQTRHFVIFRESRDGG